MDDVRAAVTDDEIPLDYGPWLSVSDTGLDFVTRLLTVSEAARPPRLLLAHQQRSCPQHQPTPDPISTACRDQRLASSTVLSVSAERISFRAMTRCRRASDMHSLFETSRVLTCPLASRSTTRRSA